MIDILKEGVIGSIFCVLNMAKIVIPLMIVLQIFRDYKILEKVSNRLGFITRLLGLSKDAIFPMMVGVFLGISYGAGAIIEIAQEGNLNKKDLFLMAFFLICCHGVIETTLIFAAIGANPYIMLFTRFIAAFGLTYILSKFVRFEEGSIHEEKQ